MLNAKAVVGSRPPEAIVLVVGFAPSKPEISVRSFDPALTVTRPVWPLKLPTKLGTGLVPDGEGRGVRVVEEPLADARQQHDVVRPAVGDQEVGMPSPVKCPRPWRPGRSRRN